MDKRLRENDVEDQFVHIENQRRSSMIAARDANGHTVRNRPLDQINAESPQSNQRKSLVQFREHDGAGRNDDQQ